MGYNVHLSYYSTIYILCSLLTYEKIRQRFLNLGLSIKEKRLCVFFFSYVLNNERKKSKTPNTFDLMLEARVANFKESPMSSFMKDSKERLKCISSMDLELMVMAKFKASNNNQCLTY
jgi:hypothetical protein